MGETNMNTRAGMPRLESPSIQITPSRSPAHQPFTTVGVGRGSVPTSPTQSKQTWPSLTKRGMTVAQPGPYMAYATPSFHQWKKLAKNAELELDLERDNHRADNARNSTIIHRANRRLIPLEKALGKARETVKHQEKIINHFKYQLMGADERKSVEMTQLRSQTEALQQRLGGAAQMYEQKILELQEKLHEANSRVGTLQAQIYEICKNIEDTSEQTDASGIRSESPAGLKGGTRGGNSAQWSNKQDMGLVALAKIYGLHLSKRELKAKLKDSEKQILLLSEENDRLKKVSREAVSRSNKFLDLVQTLKVDRDLTMNRLKEAEDVMQSLEALKDSIQVYVKNVSPRLGNSDFLSGLYKRPAYHRQENLHSEKVAGDIVKPESIAGSEVKRIGNHIKGIYQKEDGAAALAYGTGASLLKKLQDVFQVETANQSAKVVKKEREELRVTMLEAFQLLSGQKGCKLSATDNVALGVLMAVREMTRTLEELTKERDVEKASKSKEEEKIAQLESQLQVLSMERLALLESLELIKSTIRSADAGQRFLPCMKSIFNRRIVQGENISEILDLVEKLINERNEARSSGGGLKEEKLLKDKELNDLRKLQAQSQSLIAHLQVEKDVLKREQKELKAACAELRKQRTLRETAEEDERERKMSSLQGQVHDLCLEKAALTETVEAIKIAVRESSKPVHDVKSHMMGFLKRSALADQNLSEVVELVEELLIEKAEVKQCQNSAVQENEILARELKEIRALYVQSQGLCKDLDDEKCLLKNRLSVLQKTVDALQTENNSLTDSSKNMKMELSEIKSELRFLSQEKDALLETVKSLKDILQAAYPRPELLHDHSEHSSVQSNGYGTELVRMAESLVKERDEALLGGRQNEEERNRKEKELVDLNHRISQLQIAYASLQKNNDDLEREVIDYRSTIRSIEGSICHESGLGVQSFSGEGPTKNVLSEVLALKGRLQATESNLAHDRGLIERVVREIRFIFGIAPDFVSNECESEVSAILSSLKLFKTEFDRSTAVVTHYRELHEVLLSRMRKLFEIMELSDSDAERVVMRSNDNSLSKQEVPIELQSKDDELGPKITDMQLVIDEVGKLKREKLHLLKCLQETNSSSQTKASELQNVVNDVEKLRRENIHLVECLKDTELQKDHAVRRNSEHEENLLKLAQTSDRAQQNAFKLQSRLGTIQAVVSSITKERTLLKDGEASADLNANQDTTEDRLSREIEAVKDEILALRTQNADFRLKIDELVSAGGSAEKTAGDLNEKLSLAEARVQSLLARASVADFLESQIADAEAKTSALTRNLESAEVQLRTLSARASAADLLENQIEDAKAKSSDLARKLASAEDKLQTLSSRASVLDSLRSQNAAAETRVADLEKKLASVEEQLHTMSMRASFAESVGSQKAAEAETQLSDLTMKLTIADEQLRTLSARASVADLLQSDNVAASAQLAEICGMIESMDRVHGSIGTSTSSERRTDTESIGIASKINAVKAELYNVLLTKDEELSKRTKEITKLKGHIEALEREIRLSNAEMDKLKDKLNGQAEFIKKHTAEWTKVVESLKGEIIRVGGRDLKDEAEKLKKATAMEKVKELFAGALLKNPPSTNQTSTSAGLSAISNPLLSFGTFHIELLVNSKASQNFLIKSLNGTNHDRMLTFITRVHSQMKISGHNGGICQAVLHYFIVDAKTGDVTFENATIPGSQSSNLLLDLFLQPVDGKKEYQAQTGDNLGLSVKVQEVNQGAPREILFNSNIVRTNEDQLDKTFFGCCSCQSTRSRRLLPMRAQVMEAIKGQTLQNFSLWPDLVSGWRWELDTNKNKWKLMSVRWRFLLKNIFPDLSPPLQVLTINDNGRPRSTSIHLS